MTVHRDRFLVNRTSRCTEFQLFVLILYMFRAVFLPIIRSSLGVHRHWYNLCSLVICERETWKTLYIFTYLLACLVWMYGTLRTLASLIMDAHSSLSTACHCHFLNFISSGSFSTSSNHLSLGLPLFLLPYCSLSTISLTSFPDPFVLQVQSIPISSF